MQLYCELRIVIILLHNCLENRLIPKCHRLKKDDSNNAVAVSIAKNDKQQEQKIDCNTNPAYESYGITNPAYENGIDCNTNPAYEQVIYEQLN